MGFIYDNDDSAPYTYNFSLAKDARTGAITITYTSPEALPFKFSWTATVDGQPLDLIRADWTLRAALLPAGDHEVVMTFLPESYRTGALVSRIASIGLLLLLLLSVGLAFFSARKNK